MRYRPVDRQQPFLLPPSMIDWLPEEHLVWFMIEAVIRLDTTAFHARARLGGVGRRGYDPDMLLTLWMYAMAHGQRSSRQIERLCHTDVAFRIICANDAPDHTVLARFRQDHEQALTDLLTEVLKLCAELGMVRLGVIAFDGTKIVGNASMDANRSEEHLRKLAAQQMAEAAVTDAAEDDMFGEGVRGDELPEKVRDRTHRGARISAALAQIQARKAAAQRQRLADEVAAAQYLKDQANPATVRGGAVYKNIDPVAVAYARWQRERVRYQARVEQRLAQAAARGKQPGRPPVPVDEYCRVRAARAKLDAVIAAAATGDSNTTSDTDTDADDTTGAAADKAKTPAKQPKANLTDPDSRILKTRKGWIQGYNCQLSISEDELITSARATQDPNDVDQFQPTAAAIDQLAETLTNHTGRDDFTIGTMIGDAGYDSEDNLTAEGPDRLIANSNRRDLDQRTATDPATGEAPEHATAREKMTHRLRTPDGHALYKRRAPMIEPPNAWIKDRRGLHRFSRRGLTAAQSELSLACAATNLVKLSTNGITAAQLRTT